MKKNDARKCSLALFIVICFSTMESCKKDYTCQCVGEANITFANPQPNCEDISKKLFYTRELKDTKKNAEELCKHLESSGFDNSWRYTCGGQMTYEWKINCALQ
jgi:hypothetical protein